MPRGSIQVNLEAAPGGTREDVSPISLPPGSYLSSSNWLTRRGVGRPRPGYLLDFTAADGKAVIGIGIRGTRDQTDNIIVQTLNHSYYWNGTTAVDVTGAGYNASTVDQPARMVTFTQGGTNYLLLTNQANAVREWSNAGNFATTAGTPPAGKDMCVAGNRVVVVYPSGLPRTVQWSEFKDRTTWLSTSVIILDDTQGALVGCKPFGPNTFGIYKEDSVYMGTVQAALQPFQFQFIARVPGPLSPACIVDALGIHYWLAEDYAIYKFDGGSPKLVSAGLSKTIAANFSKSSQDQAHGFPFFSQDEREIWFFYPTVAGGFNAVSHNVITGAVNHHLWANVITSSLDWRMQGSATISGLDAFSSTITGLDTYSSTISGLDGSGGTTRAVLLGETAGNVYTFGQPTNDNGTAIAWSFIHGWSAPGSPIAKQYTGNTSRVYVDSVSTLWKLTTASNVISVGLEASDKVDDNEVELTNTFDTSTDAQHLLTFIQERGRFVRVHYSGTGSLPDLQYRGSILSAWPKGRV